MAGIDAPESGQTYGSRARQALSALAFGRQARVVVQDTDSYGRAVGRVYVGSHDVNAEMVRLGAAWVYRQDNRDPSLLRLETEARAAQRGLWALPEAARTPPWEWRAAVRGGPSLPAATLAAPSRAGPAGGFPCGAKRYCRETTSCAEARFHLERCGQTRLDGDRDGVPCEGCAGRAATPAAPARCALRRDGVPRPAPPPGASRRGAAFCRVRRPRGREAAPLGGCSTAAVPRGSSGRAQAGRPESRRAGGASSSAPPAPVASGHEPSGVP
nr:thermonuclease family protein [Caldovatus aquaticus]